MLTCKTSNLKQEQKNMWQGYNVKTRQCVRVWKWHSLDENSFVNFNFGIVLFQVFGGGVTDVS